MQQEQHNCRKCTKKNYERILLKWVFPIDKRNFYDIKHNVFYN